MEQASRELKTQFGFGDFLFYTCLLAVPVVTAVVAILRHSALWTLLFLLVSAGVVAVLLKFFCTRCPHYTRQGSTLKCIFFWGFPKFFTPRGGAYDKTDLAATVAATVVFVLFPLYWLLQEPGLLVVFLLSIAAFGAAIYRNECRQCVHLQCPMNRAKEGGSQP